MSLEDGLYLENLDEFVNDENRIVTYKWLSRTLGVHVNIAKQMLYTFIQEERNKDNSSALNVVYLVAGIIDSGTGNPVQTVSLVREEDLVSFKSALTALTSEHVYSVQKSKLQDSSLLYTVDLEKHREEMFQSHRHSAIEFEKAALRSASDLSNLRQKSLPKLLESKPKELTLKKKEEKRQDNRSDKENERAASISEEDTKPNSETKKALIQGQGNIAAMFANQSSGKKEIGRKIEGKTGKQNENKKKGKQGGISTFFSKQPTIKAEEKVERTDTLCNIKPEVGDSDQGSKIPKDEPKMIGIIAEKEDSHRMGKDKEEVKSYTGDVLEKEDKQLSRKKTQTKKEKTQVKGKNKKRAANKDDSLQPVKRRRRILQVSDSDSEENEDEESPLPPSPPPPQASIIESDEEEPLPPSIRGAAHENSQKKGRRRGKRAVDKTYINDAGYMVTKKEYESYSESEPSGTEEKETEESKKPAAGMVIKQESKPEPKKTSPQKTKQASIMNFFRKK